MEIEKGFTLDTAIEEQAPLSLSNTSVSSKPIPEAIGGKRALKASIATGMPVPSVASAFTDTESEQKFRESVQRQDEIEFNKQKLDLMTEIGSKTPLTPETTQAILALSKTDFYADPDSLEKKYSENVLKLLYANAANDTYVRAAAEDAEGVFNLQDTARGIVTTVEKAQKLWEDNNDWEDFGGVSGYTWDLLETLVPFKSDWVKYDSYADGWLTGENMEQQMQNLWLLPPSTRDAKILEKYNAIKAYNHQDAQDWLQNVIRYSKMDSAWQSAMTAVDMADVATLGLVGTAKKGVKAAAKVATKSPVENGMKQVVKELVKPNLDAETAMAKSGNVEQAIDLGVKREIAEAPQIGVRGEDVSRLRNKLASMYNPEAFLEDSKNLSREGRERITQSLKASKEKLFQTLNNPNQAQRLTEEALTAAIDATKKRLRSLYVNASDAVVDSRWRVVQQADTEQQTAQVVATLGTPDALPFATAADAKQVAEKFYQIDPADFNVVESGKGFYVEVAKTVDETDPSLMSAMVSTYNQTPRSVWNTLLGLWRTPEDMLSPFTRDNRNIIVPLAQETTRLFEEAISPSLTRLTKKQKQRVDDMMRLNRDYQKGEERGRWFDSVSEFEQNYYDKFKAYPSEAEVEAFMITREVSDFDWAVRSLAILRDMKSQGIVNVGYTVRVEKLNEVKSALDKGKEVVDELSYTIEDTPVEFRGKLVDALPDWHAKGENPGVFILDENSSHGKWDLLSNLNREEVNKLVKEQGYRVYQAASPFDRPFEMITDGNQDTFFYILKGAKTRNLNVTEMLPYKAGYHVEYPPGFYTKMPKFYRDKSGRLVYGGDVSLMFHASEAQAKKYHAAFDEARQLYLKGSKSGDLTEFNDYVRANLPHTPEEFVRVVEANKLDLNTPVFYTKSGQSVRDASKAQKGMHKSLFDGAIDLGESQFNLTNAVNRKFVQEKNIELPSVAMGSEGKPVFAYNATSRISPMDTMHRAMHQMIRMNVYDNYQKQAVSSFIAEFADPASPGGSVTKRSIESIRRNPIAFLLDPMWEEGVVERSKLAAAKNVHRTINNLLGTPSELSRDLDWIGNKLLNATYEKYGDEAVEKVADFAHTKLKDPARYARSIAFHSKLGLFNPVQLFLQGNSIVHAAAVTGNLARSYKAGAGSSFMRFLSLTMEDDVISSFAKKASFFGWKEDEFKEAFTIMRDAGLWNVEGDFASLDDAFSQKFAKGVGKRFLDKGLIFFREGERFVRLNAWNTAYLEWKQTNPGKKLLGNSREINKLLTRYDDLALNMTRKSTAAFQQGIWSLPTQFTTYQIHLSEQLLGKRLTRAERARALATYSALYGLPVGLGAAVPLWPWAEDVKQYAMEKGVNTNEGAMDLLVNGIMANAVEFATGKETNVSERYGPGGLSIIKDAVTGDKGFLEILFGPSGQVSSQVLKGAIESVAPLPMALVAADPSTGNESYPLLVEDFVARLREVSTVNNAAKFYYAANFSKFISKNGVYTTDADTMDGFMAAIFGIDPRKVSEAYIKLDAIKDLKEEKQKAMRSAAKNLRRAAEHANVPEDFNRYAKAAKLDMIGGGLTPMDVKRVYRDAFRDLNESFVEGINQQWVRQAPPELQWKRYQELQTNTQEGR